MKSPIWQLSLTTDFFLNTLVWQLLDLNSHAIAGGFSPAIATALYTNVGLNAAGFVYVVFGSLSVLGIYINYFCGKGDKEEDSGSPGSSPEESGGSVEMQDSKTTKSELV